MLSRSSFSLVFDLNQRASFSRPHCRGEQEPDARNSGLLDSAARNGVVDIPDLTAHTLNQFPDGSPTRCHVCGDFRSSRCPLFRCPNVRAAIHELEDGESWTIQTGAKISPGGCA